MIAKSHHVWSSIGQWTINFSSDICSAVCGRLCFHFSHKLDSYYSYWNGDVVITSHNVIIIYPCIHMAGIVLSPVSRRYRSTTIKLLWILCLVRRWKYYFIFMIKTPRWSACRSCLTVVIQIRKWCGVARALMGTQRTFCMPSTKTPVIPIWKYINHDWRGVDIRHIGVMKALSHVCICP